MNDKYLTNGRRGDWIQTFSGCQFWPLDPRAEEVDIEDIAHSLSLQCRFNGHCEVFYSVAQHCVYASHFRGLPGLLHDAAEAYLSDIPRPVKRHLWEFIQVEERIERVIEEAFELPANALSSPEMKEIDLALLHTEKLQLMKVEPTAWGAMPPPIGGLVIKPWQAGVAKRRFLSRFRELSRAR